MSVYYIASLKINYFIAQNLGNKAKPRDHNPPGYFRSQKYPGYEVVTKHAMKILTTNMTITSKGLIDKSK